MSGLSMINKYLPLSGLCLISGFFPAAAFAEPLSLNLGGFMRAYLVHNHQDQAAGSDARTFDILRDTEIHMKGKAPLEYGTTLGVTIEFTADRETVGVDKSFISAAGPWGRADLGVNNGVAALLQVSAPAADNNIDGPRQYINPVNYTLAPAIFTPLAGFDLEYAHDTSASADKLNYLTPVWHGFQAGISYTPDTGASAYAGHQEGTPSSRGLNGVNTDNVAGAYGSAYDVAARYETAWQDFKLSLGAGYVGVSHEQPNATETDLHSWNAGVNLGYQRWALGVSYSENDNGLRTDTDTRILVVGADYKTGPWNAGASYYNRTDENFNAGNALDTDRYSVGAGYQYG
ncbi:MAG TPA: porin, partial [Micavibrio sp.]